MSSYLHGCNSTVKFSARQLSELEDLRQDVASSAFKEAATPKLDYEYKSHCKRFLEMESSAFRHSPN